ASKMYSSILAFARTLEKGDKVIFYFSGHGVGDKSGNNYLLGYDGNKDAPEMFSVNINQIKTMLKEKQPAEICLIIDACRSYVKRDGRDAGKTYKTNINTGKGVRIQELADMKPNFTPVDNTAAANKTIVKTIYAASEGQQSFERKDKNNGAFTYYLTYLVDQPNSAMDVDMNKDGIISIEDMVAFADNRITDYCQRSGLPEMNPVYQTDGGIAYQPFALFKFNAEETVKKQKEQKTAEPIFQYDMDAELAKIKKYEADLSYLNEQLPVYKAQDLEKDKIKIDELDQTDLTSWKQAKAQHEELKKKQAEEERKQRIAEEKRIEFERLQKEYNETIGRIDKINDLNEKYFALERLRASINSAKYSEAKQRILPLLEPVYQRIKTAKEKQDAEIQSLQAKFEKDLSEMEEMKNTDLPDNVKQKYLSSFKSKWLDYAGKIQDRNLVKSFNALLSLNIPLPKNSNKIFDLGGGVKIEMVYIEGGSFDMGSNDGESNERPVHRVTLDGYYIGKYEVTQEQWEVVMGNNPSYFEGKKLPVEEVSWNDCQEFIRKLKQQTGMNFRMPTEAEWEYAARGGQSFEYAGSNNLGEFGWCSINTHSVGEKKANAYGLYDMSGNVWELCQDWYSDNYYSNSPTNNPQGPSSGSYRVLRGGGWDGTDYSCRVAFRFYDGPSGGGYAVGFRLLLSAE
ncbi:MAG TPA: SUMF1/EgtB/PvdO family nonheme iron enzyme, partial [bacterium]|nr:SUMF1/EgtB/PvdO family nonheme iron enzyme [bacterium]